MRVLVVDDSPDVYMLCRLTLEREGWAVSGAVNGREGVDAVDRDCPDVVLLDMMMPGYDGYFFLEHLRRRPDGDPPVVVLSAKGGKDDQERALHAGAVAYLTKPFQIDELTRTVVDAAAGRPTG